MNSKRGRCPTSTQTTGTKGVADDNRGVGGGQGGAGTRRALTKPIPTWPAGYAGPRKRCGIGGRLRGAQHGSRGRPRDRGRAGGQPEDAADREDGEQQRLARIGVDPRPHGRKTVSRPARRVMAAKRARLCTPPTGQDQEARRLGGEPQSLGDRSGDQLDGRGQEVLGGAHPQRPRALDDDLAHPRPPRRCRGRCSSAAAARRTGGRPARRGARGGRARPRRPLLPSS